MSLNNIKLERIKDMPKMKKEIIGYLFDYVARKGKSNKWYSYKGQFKYEGSYYALECECKMDNQVFTYRKMFIEHEPVEIDVHQMARAGMLND